MGGAFHESGSCSVGLLEPIEVIAKLVVNCDARIPTRVGREATTKHVEAAQILDIEKAGKIAPQLRCGEQMKAQFNVVAVTQLDFELVAVIIMSETTRLLNGINEDSGGAGDRANRGYEVA